jgi:hypothetical protein
MTRFGLLGAITLTMVIAVTSCATNAKSGLGGTGLPSTDHSTPADAFALCRQAFPGREVVSGTWTTVRDLRRYGYGGPVARHPLADAFPSAAPSDQAAWCWTKDAPDSYTAWGARAPDDIRRALTVSGPTNRTPSGPPIVP